MTQQPAQTICRSCGFAAHKPEDLIEGQCPRWAEPKVELILGGRNPGLYVDGVKVS